MKTRAFTKIFVLLALFTVVTMAGFTGIKSVAKGLENTFLKLGRKSSRGRPLQPKLVKSLKGAVKEIWTKSTLTQTLPGKVDLIFVLDRSGSIGNYKLGLARRFIKELVRYFSVSPSTTRVALITYSSSVQTNFDFKKFVNRECIFKELDKNMYSSGMTATGTALQRAIQLYQSSSSGRRQGAQRIVFVLTDGRSNRGVTPSVPASTLKNSLQAKVFALGIGNNIRDSELQSIASQSSNVFRVPSFQALQQVTNSFSQRSYDSCSGSGTKYDECLRRCTCINGKLVNCCRVRKDFTSMTAIERQRFINGMKTISRVSPYKQRYDALINMHSREFGNGIHMVNQFLPWHRYYLLELENMLREVDCRITVPYWDWSLWAHYPWRNADVWTTGSHGLGGNGAAGSRCVNNGPFATPNWAMTSGGCLRRNFNGVPPDAAQVQYCISLSNFNDFEIFLRVNLHNNFHCRVDGTMCSRDSANAPEFFLHHTFIDKVWNDWQKKSSNNLHAHFPGVSQVKMRASPFYAKDLRDNSDLPGCVKVCYDDPTHGQSRRVLKFVRGLSKTQISSLPRKEFTRVGLKSHQVFRVSTRDRIRSSQLEAASRNRVKSVLKAKLKGTLERKTGFKLVKPITFTLIQPDIFKKLRDFRIRDGGFRHRRPLHGFEHGPRWH